MREKNWLPAGPDELPSLRTRQSFPIVYPKKKWGKPEISAGKEILRFLPIQFFNTPWPMITRLSRRPRVVDLSLSQDLFCREKSHRKWKQFVISLSSDNFAVSRQPHRFHLCDVEKKDFLKVAKHRKRRERKKIHNFYINLHRRKALTGTIRFTLEKLNELFRGALVLVERSESVKASNKSFQRTFSFPIFGRKTIPRQKQKSTCGAKVDCRRNGDGKHICRLNFGAVWHVSVVKEKKESASKKTEEGKVQKCFHR